MSDQNDYLNNLLSSPLTGIIAGLLQAGGPSREPTSFGQALGQGLQGGQAFQSAGVQNALQKIQLQQEQQGQDYFNQFLGSQGAQNSAPNAEQPPAQPGALPTVQDPTQDSQYQGLMQQAMVAAHFKMDPTPAIDKANARLEYLKNQQVTLSPDQAKKLPGGVLPGQTAQFSPYSGKVNIVGDSAIKTVQVQGPNGTMMTVPYDARTGKLNDVAGNLTPKDYSKPLTGAQEQYAQDVAHFLRPLPTVSSRFPGAADIAARADYLNKYDGGQGIDATTYPAKRAAMINLTSGKDYQQNSAYSTIQTHMKTLDDAFAALDNGDVQGANKLVQWSGRQLGSSAANNAKVVNDVVVSELAKVLANGGQVTDAVRAEAQSILEPYLSKGQYAGATGYIKQLIAGKMETSKLNAIASKIPEDVFMTHLSPAAREQLQQFEQSQQGQPQGKTLTYDPASGGFK